MTDVTHLLSKNIVHRMGNRFIGHQFANIRCIAQLESEGHGGRSNDIGNVFQFFLDFIHNAGLRVHGKECDLGLLVTVDGQIEYVINLLANSTAFTVYECCNDIVTRIGLHIISIQFTCDAHHIRIFVNINMQW